MRAGAGATFCSMLSTFAIVILLMLAAAVSNNYRCGAESHAESHTPHAACTPACAALAAPLRPRR